MDAPPTNDPGVIFFLFIVGLIFLTGIAYAVLLVARWNANRIRYVEPRQYPRREPAIRRYNYPQFEPEPEPENPPNLASERQNLDRTGAFALNPEECAAVARMIEHKVTAEKPTKASIIWAGFGLKKGASARYQRASEIYDALFVLPDPTKYPQRTPDQEQARKALELA